MVTDVRRSVPAAFATAVGALALGAVFVTRFRPVVLLAGETVRPAIAAVVVLLACVSAGSLASFRRLSDQIVAGFPLFGTACAFVSLADTRLVMVLGIGGACHGAFLLGRRGSEERREIPWLLIPPIALALACALAPVNSPDELVYKLAIPRDWLAHGRMVELPLSSNSYLVMGLQSADLAALALGGGIAAKLAHFGLFLAALAIVRRVAGDAGVIALAWTPALMIIAGWAWSEWGVLAALVLSYERWREDDPQGSAIALGCAIASKYTALPWAVAFLPVVLLRQLGPTPLPRRQLWRSALLVMAVGVFFYARNTVWTGSPFAPLFLPNAPVVQNYRGSGLVNAFQGMDIFDERIADESLGIVLPLLALAGLFAWRRDRELVLLGIIQMPILIAIAPGSRNIINGVVPLAIAGARLVADRALWSRALKMVLALALAAQLVLVLYTLDSFELVPYLSGKESGPQYLSRLRNFTRPFDWLEKNTVYDARILLLAENRTFYLNRPFLAASNLDGPRVANWLSHFSDGQALRAEFQRRGIAYVLVHLPWYRVEGPPPDVIEKEYVLQVDRRTHLLLTQYFNDHGTRVYADREYVIYRCR